MSSPPLAEMAFENSDEVAKEMTNYDLPVLPELSLSELSTLDYAFNSRDNEELEHLLGMYESYDFASMPENQPSR